MVFAQWVPHSFHNQGHTMIPSLLIWTTQNYLNPTAHMVSVQRGKNIYKKKERKKDDSLNPTILFGRLSPDHTLRWSCVSALSRENLYTVLQPWLFSIQSAPVLCPSCQQSFLTSCSPWLKPGLALPETRESLQWPTGTLAASWIPHPHHRCFQRNATEPRGSTSIFFPRINLFLLLFSSPWLKEAPVQSDLRTTSEGTCCIFVFLFFGKTYSRGLLDGLPFTPIPAWGWWAQAARPCWALLRGPMRSQWGDWYCSLSLCAETLWSHFKGVVCKGAAGTTQLNMASTVSTV